MKFNVSSKELYSRTAAVSKIISGKNTMPILNKFKFVLSGDTLSITASDGENFLEGRMKVASAEGEGSVCIDARRFVELLKELPNVGIEVSVDPDTNYSVTVKYSNGEFKFMGENGDEYPTASARNTESSRLTFSAEASQLMRGVDYTLFAVGDDDLRPQMMGILWDIKPESLVFVATDTRKLVKFTDFNIRPGQTGSFILPLKSAVVLKNVFAQESDVKISLDEQGVNFESEGFTFNSRLLKGNFPDYDRVIPHNNPYVITVDRTALLSAVKRIGSFGESENGLVRFKIEPSTITLRAAATGYNSSAWESTSCDYEGNEMVIGFSGPYVSEILATLDSSEVLIKLADPSRPGLFAPAEDKEGTELVMILMPMLVAEF